ncbi:MAG TPA: hypothetical protein VFW87_13285 [Pirellulales bacterium]|nr:hypothetical protein [Pirellulales bacterium]
MTDKYQSLLLTALLKIEQQTKASILEHQRQLAAVQDAIAIIKAE